MILVVDSQYFSPIIFYKTSIGYTHILFDQYELFRKMSFRNRCVVAGANGPVVLSIPLEQGRNQRTPMKDVRISNRYNWQEQHWKTLTSCYSRSPWFDFYRHELDKLYQKKIAFLLEWNLECFDWIAKKIDLAWVVQLTPDYQPNFPATTYLDLRNKLLPKTMGSLPSARYRQVFEERTGFIPHLSILDLLFCLGKDSREFLMQ